MSETPGQHDREWQEGRGVSLLPSLLLSHSRGGQRPGFPSEGGELACLQLKPISILQVWPQSPLDIIYVRGSLPRRPHTRIPAVPRG